jgi:histidine triad (HIT) family protein
LTADDRKVLLGDCDIEVTSPDEGGNCLVKLTHRPTGQTASAYGRKRGARSTAFAELRQTAGCPFCARIQRGDWEAAYGHVVAFTPLNPVTPGHLLVVPCRHVPDAFHDAVLTAQTMEAAVVIGAGRYDSCNVITSVGAPATQTVRHLHLHLVPRRKGDGLALPWTGQRRD